MINRKEKYSLRLKYNSFGLKKMTYFRILERSTLLSIG